MGTGAQALEQAIGNGARLGEIDLVESDRRRTPVAFGVGCEIGPEIGLARLRQVLGQKEAHLLDQMLLDQAVLLEPALVGLAQEHSVVDRALHDARPLRVRQGPAEELRLLVDQRLDGRRVDHDGLALGRLAERVGPEQQPAQDHEVDQRLAARERPEPSAPGPRLVGGERDPGHPGRTGLRSAGAARRCGRPHGSDALAARREQDALGRDAMADRPAETVLGPAGREILAADPARIARPVEQIEQVGIVDLADIRLVALGHARDLDVGGDRLMALEAPREVAGHDLGVVEVELELQARLVQLGDQGGAFGRRVEQVARNVAAVDRLDQGQAPGARAGLGGAPEVRLEDPKAGFPAGAGGWTPAMTWIIGHSSARA